VVPIDSVEALTGLDFFPQLTEGEEKTLEKTVCHECWDWQGLPSVRTRESGYSAPSVPSGFAQCKGKNADGSPCPNFIKGAQRFCSLHRKSGP
jgi:hypothetical protein